MAKKAKEVVEPEAVPKAPKAFNPASAPIADVCKFIEEPGVKVRVPDVGGKAETMARNLAGQDKIKTLIQLESKEPKGSFRPVNLNGFKMEVQKGIFVRLPEQVAELLQDSYLSEQEALSYKRIDREEIKDGVSIETALN